MTVSDSSRAQSRTRLEAVRTGLLYGFAAIGLIVVVAVVAGAAVDVASFDRTSGGYEPPYDEFTGEPIDWDAETYTTRTGMVQPGYVIDNHLDCTTGTVEFDVLRVATVEFREVSDRAIAVHGPREACLERGFDPQF